MRYRHEELTLFAASDHPFRISPHRRPEVSLAKNLVGQSAGTDMVVTNPRVDLPEYLIDLLST